MMTLQEAKLRFPPIWTIYRSPKDYPGQYPVRVWYGAICEPVAKPLPALAAARHWVLAQGASFCLGRQPEDDPCIVESWI